MQEAVLLAERIEGHFKIYLFQLDGFYIENYTSLALPAMNHTRSFRSLAPLEPYLEQIQINL